METQTTALICVTDVWMENFYDKFFIYLDKTNFVRRFSIDVTCQVHQPEGAFHNINESRGKYREEETDARTKSRFSNYKIKYLINKIFFEKTSATNTSLLKIFPHS